MTLAAFRAAAAGSSVLCLARAPLCLSLSLSVHLCPCLVIPELLLPLGVHLVLLLLLLPQLELKMPKSDLLVSLLLRLTPPCDLVHLTLPVCDLLSVFVSAVLRLNCAVGSRHAGRVGLLGVQSVDVVQPPLHIFVRHLPGLPQFVIPAYLLRLCLREKGDLRLPLLREDCLLLFGRPLLLVEVPPLLFQLLALKGLRRFDLAGSLLREQLVLAIQPQVF